MPQAVAQRLLDEFGLAFAEGYGLTETAAPSHANPPERAKLQCLGMPIFGVDSVIVDPETLQELPPGEVGEIVVRGPMVTQGYWRLPEVTASALRNGWFHTGDGGRMDEDGYLFIADRLKDMIITGGENVYSAEVEAALRSHPAVTDAAVIGVPDARWGESVHAVVVLSSAADVDPAAASDLLKAWCREQLAGYKCPRGISFAEALPLSAAGKVLKTVLRAAHQP
jgi:acyl-CoA synthetase (AMP-forming)/AMP-acid ligase II